MFIAATKLKRCKKRLKSWSRAHFGNVKQQIKHAKGQLWHAEEVLARTGEHKVVVWIKKELNTLYGKEEKIWQQQSRVQWLQHGDQNTKFFHGTTTQRKMKNFIKGLRDGNGDWREDEEVFSALLTDFYTHLFTSLNPHDFDRVLDGVEAVVTETMHEDLMRPFTSEEVAMAIKEMAPLKASGPDGMPLLFYQTYWSDIGMDVAQAVLSCLNLRSILRSINHTFITLIPKVHNPKRVSILDP